MLRHARADDLDAVHAIMSDAEVLRYWSTPPHRTHAETEQWLESMIVSNANGSSDFIIEANGVVIGKIGVWQMPEIGFYLARSAWGQGYAIEALRAVIAHVFDGHTDHLFADVDPRNSASLRLLMRAGFVETGRAQNTMEVNGEWCDSIYLELNKDNYNAQMPLGG